MRTTLVCFLMAFMVAPAVQKGLECAMCIEFVSEIDKEEIQADKDLKNTMDKKCREMFDMPIKDDICERLVNKEFDTIIKKIENNEQPSKICKDINMC